MHQWHEPWLSDRAGDNLDPGTFRLLGVLSGGENADRHDPQVAVGMLAGQLLDR